MSEGEKLVPYVPTPAFLASIGTIILAGSEIDQLLNLALFKIVDVRWSLGFVLLGRTTIGVSLARLRQIIDLHPDEELWNKLKNVEEDLTKFIEIRNGLAHGVIVGTNDKGLQVINMTSNFSDDMGIFKTSTRATNEASLQKFAGMGCDLVAKVKQVFDVLLLHDAEAYTVVKSPGKSLKSQRNKSRSNSQKSHKSP